MVCFRNESPKTRMCQTNERTHKAGKNNSSTTALRAGRRTITQISKQMSILKSDDECALGKVTHSILCVFLLYQ